MNKITLIFGGARCGKSHYAEQLANKYNHKIYIATAENRDGEMHARIEQHKQRRGTEWQTIECPLKLADHISKINQPDTIILIDCLTLWLSNMMEANQDIAKETENLTTALKKTNNDIILISNEVGLSIVPENPLARAFRDAQGLLNQTIASAATNVIFMAAGLPLIMKGNEE